MRPNKTKREYLTPHEVATILGVSVETVRRLARNGQMSALHVGRQWRFDPAVVRAETEKRRITA